MPLATAEPLIYHVTCPYCRHATEKALSWLVDQERMTCGSCGRMIDLQGPDHRAVFERLFDFCRILDVEAAKRNRLA
jgi:transcription elongation factor Elf1